MCALIQYPSTTTSGKPFRQNIANYMLAVS